MIVTECLYNPVCDMKPVDSFGWLDLASAFVNKTVPSDTVTQESDYNGISEPDSILGKPDDVFAAFRMAEHVEASSSQSSNESD